MSIFLSKGYSTNDIDFFFQFECFCKLTWSEVVSKLLGFLSGFQANKFHGDRSTVPFKQNFIGINHHHD